MAYKLICPECGSDNLEPHVTPHAKSEKFKCNRCGKVRLMASMQYESVQTYDDNPKGRKKT